MKGNKEEEKILNEIALKVNAINELKQIKEKVNESLSDDIKFKIQTTRFVYFGDIIKEKSELSMPKYVMQLILDTAIEKEQRKIDQLIDLLIEAKGWDNIVCQEKKKKK